MAIRPWPDIPEEQAWALELMEERLQRTAQSAEQLQSRAGELRARAAQTEFRGVQDAALALADRYEKAALTRDPRPSSHGKHLV